MKQISMSLLILTCLGFMACGNSRQTSTTGGDDSSSASTEIVDEPVEKVADFDQMENTSRMLFAMVLPQGIQADDFEQLVISKCTPSFIEALKSWDEFEDGNIAWYALRTMEQDGSGENEIIAVTPDGNDAMVVEYLDMGHKGTTRLQFVKDGEDYKVNSAIVTYNGENRTIK